MCFVYLSTLSGTLKKKISIILFNIQHSIASHPSLMRLILVLSHTWSCTRQRSRYVVQIVWRMFRMFSTNRRRHLPPRSLTLSGWGFFAASNLASSLYLYFIHTIPLVSRALSLRLAVLSSPSSSFSFWIQCEILIVRRYWAVVRLVSLESARWGQMWVLDSLDFLGRVRWGREFLFTSFHFNLDLLGGV